MRNAKLMALYPFKMNLRATDKIPFPFYIHTPGPYTVNTGDANISESNVVNQGAVATPNGRGLMTVSWTSLFTIEEYFLFYSGDDDVYPPHVMAPPPGFQFDDAFDSIRLLTRMKDESQVARLQISDRLIGEYDVDMLCLCKSFVVREDPFEPDCRYYDITFQEYRPIILRKVPPQGAAISHRRADNKGRLIGDKNGHYTLPKEMGIVELMRAAYGKTGTTISRRFWTANGGPAWRAKMHETGQAFYRHENGQRNGPWFLSKGLKVYIPPLNGPLHPK